MPSQEAGSGVLRTRAAPNPAARRLAVGTSGQLLGRHAINFARSLPADPLLAIVAQDVITATVTSPPLGLTMPQMIEIIVVLPAPFGPSSARISPSSMSRLTPFKAWKPLE